MKKKVLYFDIMYYITIISIMIMVLIFIFGLQKWKEGMINTDDKKILICISSKSPNPSIYECVKALNTIQIKNNPNYKVIIVDSDSNDFTNYEKVKKDFPNVDICYVKNKNYEYGAFKYALNNYSDFDIYILLQDSCILHKEIDINLINNNTAYIYKEPVGYNNHIEIKKKGESFLDIDNIDYKNIINNNFNICTHNIMIISKYTLTDIFNKLTIPPIDKDGSCIYERNFGIYFIINNYNTLDLSEYINKVHGKRM